MKPYKTLIFIFSTLLSLLSCKRHESNYQASFGTDSLKKVNAAFFGALDQIQNIENQKNCKAYIVIPNTGCSGCISEAEMLLKTNVKIYKNVKFILTNINSVKELRIKLQMDVVHNPNIILDKQNFFYKGMLFSIYPRVYLLKDGVIVKEVNVSPFDDGLGALKAHVAKLSF